MRVATSSLLLFSLHLSVVASAATPVHPHHNLPARRAPAKPQCSGAELERDFNQQTADLRQKGWCRMYDRLDGRTGPELCSNKCGKLTGKSVSCVYSHKDGTPEEPTFIDPDCHEYHLALCVCDIPVLDMIISNITIALPSLADVGCEIMFRALEAVFEYGALAIPGVGEEMDAGMVAGIKAAKTIADNGSDALGFLQWLAHPCGNSAGTQGVDKFFDTFDPLSRVADAIVPGNGCKKKACPGRKKSMPSRPSDAPEAKFLQTAKPTSS